MAQGEFSVYWWMPDGTYIAEHRFVDARTAVQSFVHLTRCPAAQILGVIKRVMVTDGGDNCNMEWNSDEGGVFPDEIKGRDKPATNPLAQGDTHH